MCFKNSEEDERLVLLNENEIATVKAALEAFVKMLEQQCEQIPDDRPMLEDAVELSRKFGHLFDSLLRS